MREKALGKRQSSHLTNFLYLNQMTTCSDIFSNLHSDAKEIEIQVLLQTENLSEMKRFQVIFRSFHIQALYEKYKNAERLLHM